MTVTGLFMIEPNHLGTGYRVKFRFYYHMYPPGIEQPPGYRYLVPNCMYECYRLAQVIFMTDVRLRTELEHIYISVGLFCYDMIGGCGCTG